MTREMNVDALIVASHDDFHARAVAREVEKLGFVSLIIDSADFPSRLELDLEVPATGYLTIRDVSNGSVWKVHEHCGVWWRRPRSHSVDDAFGHPKLREFAIDECRQAFLGSLAARCPRFFNQVGASRQATLKAHHLQIANSVGWRTPKTIITNDPHRARRFIADLNKECVYKPFTGTDFGFFETRRFSGESDLAELWRIRNCPAVIQEHISGTFDLRITVVGNDVYSAAMDLSASRHGVDCRVERLPTTPFDLPSEVSERVLGLTRSLGLTYAAHDVRLDENGEFIFLEVNPEGQYLWIEIDSGLPISAALARELCNSRSGSKG